MTSPIRTTPSLRQPGQTTGRPDVTPRSTIPVTSTIDPTPLKETLKTDGGGPMFTNTFLALQDMDITTPE